MTSTLIQIIGPLLFIAGVYAFYTVRIVGLASILGWAGRFALAMLVLRLAGPVAMLLTIFAVFVYDRRYELVRFLVRAAREA